MPEAIAAMSTPQVAVQLPQAIPMILRVSVPSVGVQKALRANPTDLVWAIKKQVCEKVASDLKDALNHGLYMAPSGGKLGKFLDEKRDLGSYQMETNCLLEFIPKKRQNAPPTLDGDVTPIPKNQKRFLEDVQKGNVDKVKEKGVKGMDPNFWSETGETPLSFAVLNNDKDMLTALIENGAYLDYRMSDAHQWKTPMHLAAMHNKPTALQTLINYGGWINCPDILGLAPLYYAASSGHPDCVEKLLLSKAETENFDESGKGPLHQACLNNHEQVVALLIDCGASMTAVNVAGNTPLHVAAARNATECLKWLLLRGADREKGNKSGQSPHQVAALAGSTDAVEILKAFTEESIIPPPPRLEDLTDTKRATLPASPPHKAHYPTSKSSEFLRSSLEFSSAGAAAHLRAGSEFATSPQNTLAARRNSQQLGSLTTMTSANVPAGAQSAPVPGIAAQRRSPRLDRPRPDSDVMDETNLGGMQHSYSVQSIAQSVILQDSGAGASPNSRKKKRDGNSPSASGFKIPPPPSEPRPASLPAIPRRSRPTSLESTKKSPLSSSPFSFNNSPESQINMFQPPAPQTTAGSISSLNQMDSSAILAHLRNQLASGVEFVDLESQFDTLLLRLASMEASLTSATTKTAKLEARNTLSVEGST